MLDSLRADEHAFCAGSSSGTYLDTCVWGSSAKVAVAPNARMLQRIVVEKGVRLKVRINDPLGLLPPSAEGLWGARNLTVGVTHAGGYVGVATASVDAKGRDYQMAIPVGRPLWLALFSSELTFADESGNFLPSPGAGVPFQAKAGSDVAFTFTIAGRRSQ
jgi:hypothetical protein